MLAAAAIGLILGLRHAFEPDHLAAVSTLATRESRLWPAARLGLAWGVGHTATVGLVALIIIALGIRLPESLWPAAELVVAGLLILLGGVVVWRYARGRWHMHVHQHESGKDAADRHIHLHSHHETPAHGHAHAAVDARRSLGFGIAHGLAGSGAVVALLLAAAPGTAARVVYFAGFGLGTIAGMLAVSVALAAVVRAASQRSARWATALHVGAAVGSVVAGLVLASHVL